MDIYDELNLTASAGVSYCKFLAKIASDMNKPNGLTVIKPHKALSFIESLPVHNFFGVGKVTAEKMKSLGIETGLELKKYSREDLVSFFGKSGSFYYDIVRGIDDRPVVSDRIRKSYAVERTLDEDTSDIEVIHDFADTLAMKLNQGIIKNKFKAKTLTLKLKNSDFIIKTRSHTHHSFFTETSEIQELAHYLINQNQLLCKKIRLIGLTLSNFEHEKQEINFIENPNIGQLELDFGTEYF
jgi:DNA polymerase-4